MNLITDLFILNGYGYYVYSVLGIFIIIIILNILVPFFRFKRLMKDFEETKLSNF
tara:strand:+ start:13594 stop:13758 length:165 start_codon:yes stop_codon:yes gene_type:complete